MYTDDFGIRCDQMRVLPWDPSDPLTGNTLVSYHGYLKEIEHRKQLNKRCPKDDQWALPKWEDLKIYTPE